MQLVVVSGEDVERALPMREAIDAMAEAFGQLSAGRAVVPVRHSLESEGGVTLFMPGFLRDTGALGAKVVSVFHDNPGRGLPAIHAAVLILDAGTGQPRALLEGSRLTALRTGAATGLATDLLARPEASVLACYGAGVQARTQVEAVRTVRPIREVRIVSRTRESAETLAAELLDGDPELAVDVPEDRNAALAGAHVVVAATSSPEPVFDGARVEAGTHVNSIGAYTPEMREVDAELVRRSRIVVDQREAALEEAGDLIGPIRDGVITDADLHAELGEIVNGARPGRASADEITLFKSVGSAAQDLAAAVRVLARVEAEGWGTVVEL